MPSYVDPEKCDGCKGGDKTACMYICPNDLMVLNVEDRKSTRLNSASGEPGRPWVRSHHNHEP